MPDATAIRETIDRYCATFSAADRDGWLATFAEDATLEDPVGSPVRKGRGEIGEFFDQMHGMAGPISLTVNGAAIVVGAEAAIPLLVRSTIGGATFELDVVDVMTFGDDGRITSQRAFVDLAAARPV